MSERQQDILKSQTSAEEANSNGSEIGNTELLSQEPIVGTPFNIVGNDEIGYVLTMGMYKLSMPQQYRYDVEKLLQDRMWDIIATMAMIFAEKIYVTRDIEKQAKDLTK